MPRTAAAGAGPRLDARRRACPRPSRVIDLFSPEGEAALARIAGRRTLYAFDFDGTLAPLVDRPDDARASDRTMALLAKLATMVPTALLTGRSVDDLHRRMPFTPLHVVGNHGAEGLPGSAGPSWAASVPGSNADQRAIVAAWLERLPHALAAEGLGADIVVEPKSHSLSIHYRLASDQEAAEHALHAAIAALHPAPRVIGGKCVFNLLPEGAPDKGDALATLVRFERCDAAFFIGDDVTDESAFRIASPSWVTVHVGAHDESAACFFIADQSAIDHCLERLLVHAEGEARR